MDTDFGMSTAVVTWTEPIAVDNSGSQTLTSSHSPGSSFKIGLTFVLYTSVDTSGNKATATFSVLVVEGMQELVKLVKFQRNLVIVYLETYTLIHAYHVTSEMKCLFPKNILNKYHYQYYF